ncbi:MAG: amidohydrolase [Deltaproteobacteria bacterium]|nr:amidohydrolase [Deltaproteobacteria bacterium]
MSSPSPSPSLGHGARILANARVRVLDDEGTIVEAIGFRAGRVAAVGTLAEVRAELMVRAEEVDLGGATVCPGFVDAHHHLALAVTYGGLPEVRWPVCRSLADVLAVVRARAAVTPPGAWVTVYGYDEARLAELRRPTRDELDAAAPEHPVLVIHHSFHEGVLGSRGLAALGLSRSSAEPPGGRLGRGASGELDGWVAERSFGPAEAAVRRALLGADREGWFRAANDYQARVLAAGITHLADAAVPPSLEELYGEWQRRGELHLGVTMMPLVESIFAAPFERLGGRPTGWSEGRLSIGALKLFADGGTSCALCFRMRDALVQFGQMLARTVRERSTVAWRLARDQPFRIDARLAIHTGFRLYEPATLAHVLRAADERGFAVAVHAGGNEAVEEVAAIWSSRGASAGGAALPRRIEHLFFANRDTARRAADAGVHAVVQPAHLDETGAIVVASGLPGKLGFHPYRTLLDAGVRLAGSSDAPVNTFDVWSAVRAAVERRLADGRPVFPSEALAVREVLHMYTRGGAAALGMAGEIGQLRVGARADAVVLAADPWELEVERIGEAKILATYTGGERRV